VISTNAGTVISADLTADDNAKSFNTNIDKLITFGKSSETGDTATTTASINAVKELATAMPAGTLTGEPELKANEAISLFAKASSCMD
jgi:hypothetical protein